MNKRLVKNYIYNTLYQILVLIVPLVTTPYVSRILGVTNIGIFQYAQSVATYFVLVGAVGTSLYGQREIAYLQDNLVESTKAFWEIELFRVIGVVISTIVYFLSLCIHGEYPDVYLVLIIEVLATAFDISWFFMGKEEFKLTVIRNTIIKLSGVVCVFLFVKSPDDLLIYTACMTFPIFIGNISLWFSLKDYLIKITISYSELFRGIIARLTRIFILFLPQVAMEVYLVLDKTMLGLLGTSVDQVGYYSQAQKIVKVVLSIVTSLGVVMLPTMSSFFARGDKEGIKESIIKAFRFIFIISFALMFGLCAVAERFVPIFFGEGYDPVIILMIIISPIIVIIGISTVFGRQYLLPTNQQKEFTISIIIGAVVNVVLNIVLIPIMDAVGASIATVLAELTITVIQAWLVRKQLPLKQCFRSIFKYAIFGAIMYFACISVGHYLPQNKIWAIGLIVITGMIVYFLELLISRDSFFEEIKALKNEQ